jgi:hypothetical protein
VTDFAGDISIVLSDQNQRGLLDVFQAHACIVALARKQMPQVELHRTEIAYPDLPLETNPLVSKLAITLRPEDLDN